ncbi:MAG: hypothetical protein U1E52_00340 [Geminicoccaceae bacterium]
MNMVRIAGIIGCIASLTSCWPFDPDGPTTTSSQLLPEILKTSLNPAGYQPVNPASQDYAPGLVFYGDKQDDKVILQRVICVSLFGRDELGRNKGIQTSQDLVLNTKQITTYSAGLNFSLLEKLIKKNSASLDLAKFQHSDNEERNLGKVTEVYIADSGQFTENGEPVQAAANCKPAIDQYKAKHQYTDHVWILANALQSEGASINIENSTDLTSELKAELMKVVSGTASVGINTKSTQKNTIVDIKTPLTIGAGNPRLLKDVIFSGAVAASRDMIPAKISIDAEDRTLVAILKEPM